MMARLITINLRSKIKWSETRFDESGYKVYDVFQVRHCHAPSAVKLGYTRHWHPCNKAYIYHGE